MGLSLAEASHCLEHLRLVPTSKAEQDEIRMLFMESDTLSHGRIDLQGFQALWLRVDERLRVLQYEDGLEAAVKLGFGEDEVREFWKAYDEFERDDHSTFASDCCKQAMLALQSKHML